MSCCDPFGGLNQPGGVEPQSRSDPDLPGVSGYCRYGTDMCNIRSEGLVRLVGCVCWGVLGVVVRVGVGVAGVLCRRSVAAVWLVVPV